MGYLKYKGYTGSVEFSEEDDCLFGRVKDFTAHSFPTKALPLKRFVMTLRVQWTITSQVVRNAE